MTEYEYIQENTQEDVNQASAYHDFCIRRAIAWDKLKRASAEEDLIPPREMLESIAKYLSIIPTMAEITSKLSGVDALLTAFESAAEIRCDSVTAMTLDECRNQWRLAVRSYNPNADATSAEVWIILADVVAKLTKRAFVTKPPYCNKWQPVVFDGAMGEM